MAACYIHMDQGLVIDLRNDTLCSGRFSSCAPIVLYNAVSHLAGLSHLGGCDALDEPKITHLNVLATVVRPTVVHVLAGAGEYRLQTFTFAPIHGHVGIVSALFAPPIVVHHNFNGISDYSSITVSEIGGALNIAPDNPLAMTALRTAATINGRGHHFGFIGEKHDDKLSLWL